MTHPALQRLLEGQDPQLGMLDALQPFRVHSILLVASLYDSYILSEGEHLYEELVGEYHNLGMTAPPRITRVSSHREALALLKRRPFDLVIAMAAVNDMPLAEFSRAVKHDAPERPVVVLGYNLGELVSLGAAETDSGVDRAFLWRGDMRLFLAIIKLVEDRVNVEHDTRLGGVRTLILIEDSIAFYSSYLPLLFEELVKQTEQLIAEGVTLSQRLVRMRLRPKILLASTYEEGWALYTRYRETLLGVISDIQFPREGRPDPIAGVRLFEAIRVEDHDTPLLLQSSQERLEAEAVRLSAGFVRKGSATLLHDFQNFMLESLGFGDFVIRLPNGQEVSRARNLGEMIEVLPTIPAAALRFHGSRNHFSNWLMARTEFDLAQALRRLRLSDFRNMEDMRDFLVATMVSLRARSRRGHVERFDPQHFDPASAFVRIGGGSLGGKGRGLAFVHNLVSQGELQLAVDGARLAVPRSAVLGTDVFDRFLAENELLPFALSTQEDRAITTRFLQAPLPADVVAALTVFLEHVRYPLAVRSSSLLEDSHHQPAAGIYFTHMLANSHAADAERLAELQAAVKHIYASVFFASAKSYLRVTGNRVEEEKMAVVLQEVVGRRFGDVLYPHLSGVAANHNFYAVSPQRPEDGVARVALGLGKTVVEGGRSLMFSPAWPQALPQLDSPRAALANTQSSFWALDLTQRFDPLAGGLDTNLVSLTLADAEDHGSLWPVASVYSADDYRLYDDLSKPGPRVVTFAPILKHDLAPLAEVLELFLHLGAAALSGPVEIEFAADLQPDDEGRRLFALLQIRPLALYEPGSRVDLAAIRPQDSFVHGARALGSGRVGGLRDVVAVRRDTFDRNLTMQVAEEVGRLNARLVAESRPYLLMGPGRWGTADRFLGVPVTWDQISGARAILEHAMADLPVEPSQGTHFFHNMTSLGISYLTARSENGTVVDWTWLESHAPLEEGQWVRHFRLPEPVAVLVDVNSGQGVVLKRDDAPQPVPPVRAGS